MKLLFNYIKKETFDIRLNGIQLVESDNIIEIYNDPFSTVPLYIAKEKTGGLIIFSNFDDIYEFESIDLTIDEVGFWEIVLFGSELWT
jgi:hypothetical protein